MNKVLRGLTPDILAHGLVAASELYGVNPTFVFGKGDAFASNARICVGFSVLSLMQRKPNAKDGAVGILARILAVSPTRLAPSSLKAPISVRDVNTVAATMARAGLDPMSLAVFEPNKGEGRRTINADVQPQPQAVTRADMLTVRIPVRGHAGTFDPAVLGERKSAAPAPIAKGRQPDVTVQPKDTLAAMFALDDDLVAACLRQGGFPIEYQLPSGEKVLGTADKRRWERRP